MSETRIISPIDQYYAGQPANFPLIEHGRPGNLTVASHWPFRGQILECAASAEWRVFDDPNSPRQFEGLVFNPEGKDSTLLVPTTAGEYSGGHMYEGALWAAQNPNQRLVLLPTFNLTNKELAYYAKTGKLTDEEGNPLPSMSQLAHALGAAGIEATVIYGRSAGTKEASVLPKVMPSVSGVVLGAPPQLVKRSTQAFVQSALTENSDQRLEEVVHTAVDEYQVNEQWKNETAQARKNRSERQRPTGAIAATVGNMAVRVAHAVGLAKGPDAFMADLHGVKTNVDLVVYTDDAFYGQGLQDTLGHVAAQFENQHESSRMRVVPISGGHRIPERYPRATNDITDALLRS
jgi:hypothetical protein